MPGTDARLSDASGYLTSMCYWLLREERHHTQEDLASRAGITLAALARIERGNTNATWTTVRSIAAALDIKLSDLGATIEQATP